MPHTPRPVVVVPPNACQLPAFASVLVSADAVVTVAMAANAITAVIPHRFMLSPSPVSTLSVAHLDGRVSGRHAWSSVPEGALLKPTHASLERAVDRHGAFHPHHPLRETIVLELQP